MRLIDADEVLWKMVGAAIPQSAIYGKAFLIAKEELQNAPTVEAIPVEWLKKHLPNLDDYVLLKGYPMYDELQPLNMGYDKGFDAGWESCCHAISENIWDDWEEENEAN